MGAGVIDTVRVSVSSTFIFLVIVGNVRLLFYGRNSLPENSTLKKVLPILCLSSLVAGLTGFTGILLSAWSDGPLETKLPCEVFSTFDHVFAGGANWMLAVVAMERYLRMRAPAEHSSTFSARNLKILAAGLYILQIMISVGPFYGLGEYTVYRGKMSLFVTLNVSSVTTHSDACTVDEMVSLLRRRYIQLMPQRVPDPVMLTAHYLTTQYDVIVARARWEDDGLLFLMRVPNTTVLNSFWEAYTDGSISERVRSIVYSPPVVQTLGDYLPDVVSYMDVDEYTMLRDGYLPYQELGVCDGDFTSVNQHSDIWMAYSILLTALLPCALAVVSLTAVSVHQLRGEGDKSELPEDLFFSRALTVDAWLSSIAHLTFITVNILFARGTIFSPGVLLSVSFLIHTNRFSLYFIWCLIDRTPLTCLGNIGFNFFRLFSKASATLRSDTNGRRRSFASKTPTPVSL